jgi:hypothetical protein
MEDTAVRVRLDNHRKILSMYNGLKTLLAQFDSTRRSKAGHRCAGQFESKI